MADPEYVPLCLCSLKTTPSLAPRSPLTGHLANCPVNARILENHRIRDVEPVHSWPEVEAVIRGGSPEDDVEVPPWERHRLERKPDHDQPERVPFVVWVWSTRTHHKFEFFPGATVPVAIEVPIGWSLVPHGMAGVVLRSVWGETLCAGDVLDRARNGHGSFRLATSLPSLETPDAAR